ncbi:hypothetical protein SprV_0100186100 [Sparganum proliferum]
MSPPGSALPTRPSAISSTVGARRPQRVSLRLLSTTCSSLTSGHSIQRQKLIIDLFASRCVNFGLTINMDKTVIMHQPPPIVAYSGPRIPINGTQLKTMDNFSFICSTLLRCIKIDDGAEDNAKGACPPLQRRNEEFLEAAKNQPDDLRRPRTGPPTWKGTGTTEVAIYKDNRIAVTEAKREVSKSQAALTRTVNSETPPTCPLYQLKLCARVGLVGLNALNPTIPTAGSPTAPALTTTVLSTTIAVTTDAQHPHAPPSITTNSIIPDATSASTTTITAATPATDQNTPDGLPTTTLTITIPTPSDLDSVPTGPHANPWYCDWRTSARNPYTNSPHPSSLHSLPTQINTSHRPIRPPACPQQQNSRKY